MLESYLNIVTPVKTLAIIALGCGVILHLVPLGRAGYRIGRMLAAIVMVTITVRKGPAIWVTLSPGARLLLLGVISMWLLRRILLGGPARREVTLGVVSNWIYDRLRTSTFTRVAIVALAATAAAMALSLALLT